MLNETFSVIFKHRGAVLMVCKKMVMDEDKNVAKYGRCEIENQPSQNKILARKFIHFTTVDEHFPRILWKAFFSWNLVLQ